MRISFQEKQMYRFLDEFKEYEVASHETNDEIVRAISLEGESESALRILRSRHVLWMMNDLFMLFMRYFRIASSCLKIDSFASPTVFRAKFRGHLSVDDKLYLHA